MTMPSDVDAHISLFDRFASLVEKSVAHAWFFAACVALVAGWFPTLFFMPIDASQLIINTATTIVTFLLVALLQNTQRRNDASTQHKLNAVAAHQVATSAGLRAIGSALVRLVGGTDLRAAMDRLADADKEVAAAVGLEDREST